MRTASINGEDFWVRCCALQTSTAVADGHDAPAGSRAFQGERGADGVARENGKINKLCCGRVDKKAHNLLLPHMNLDDVGFSPCVAPIGYNRPIRALGCDG